MKSSFSIKGHPLHPILVSVPIGLILWTLAADIAYLKTTNIVWYTASFWGGVGAIITALLAAIPGFGDLFTIARRNGAFGIGLLHMLCNLIGVGLFGIAAMMATSVDITTGAGFNAVLILHVIAVVSIGIAGWLGGEMVYKRRLSVHEPGLVRGNAPISRVPAESPERDAYAQASALPFTPLTRAR